MCAESGARQLLAVPNVLLNVSSKVVGRAGVGGQQPSPFKTFQDGTRGGGVFSSRGGCRRAARHKTFGFHVFTSGQRRESPFACAMAQCRARGTRRRESIPAAP